MTTPMNLGARLARVFLCAAVAALLAGCAAGTEPAGKQVPTPQTPVASAPAALTVGTPAPPLEVQAWLTGEPVTEYSPRRVYLVEFFATFSGPCIESLPRLNRIRRDEKEVVVIAVAASEPAPGAGEPDERRSRLESFIQQHADEMDYRVAYDGSKTSWTRWVRAAGRSEVPTVFIIGRDGRIAWVGHPDDMERPLAAAMRRR